MSESRIIENARLLAALGDPSVSWSSIAVSIRKLGSVHAALQAEGMAQGDLFRDSDDVDQSESQWADLLARLQGRGIECLAISDLRYPESLQRQAKPPPFLFVAGRIDLLEKPAVAVVGSRRAGDRALRTTRDWSREISSSGGLVMSGLAAGVDREAHIGALDVEAPTVAVLGTGILNSYPPDNAALQSRISQEGGLLVSQFFPSHPPSRATFPMRNAVMAGLARVVLVMEAEDRSGTTLQARLAARAGRRVALHHHLNDSAWAIDLVSRGKAEFVRSSNDVAELLR